MLRIIATASIIIYVILTTHPVQALMSTLPPLLRPCANVHARRPLSLRNCLNEYSTSVAFPDIDIQKAITLIHSPQQWAHGAGILLGYGSFTIRHCYGPLICGKTTSLSMEVTENVSRCNMTVIFIAKDRHDSSICFYRIPRSEDFAQGCNVSLIHSVVKFRVYPYEPSAKGFTLSIRITDNNAGINGDELFGKQAAELLKIGLFACIETDVDEGLGDEKRESVVKAIERFTELAIAE